MNQPTQFTGKADIYSKYRPTYPTAYIDYLIEMSQVSSSSLIADIGAGTGILTQLLLERDLTVMAVEPNEDMRQSASQALQAYPKCTIINGTAEKTGLADHSVDLITVAQAFHWFDQARFQQECRRMGKLNAKVALVWNSRDASSDLVKDNAALCQHFCPNFKGFSGGIGESPDVFTSFFRAGNFEVKVIPYQLMFDLDHFIGRNLSSSYAPKATDAAYEPFVQGLTELFHKYAQGNKLALPNLTRSYIGCV